jgi:hypothetical protein
MKSFKFLALSATVVFFMGMFLVSAQCEDSAFDQLSGMTNTGVTFDGTDGTRTDGWDNDFHPSAAGTDANIEPVDTGYYTQSSNYGVDTSTSTDNSYGVDTSSSAASAYSVDTTASASTSDYQTSSSTGDSSSYSSASTNTSYSYPSYGDSSFDTTSYSSSSSSDSGSSSSTDSTNYGSESAD